MGRRHACSCSHRDPYHYMRQCFEGVCIAACRLYCQKSVAKVGAGPKGGIVDGSYGRREDNRAGRRPLGRPMRIAYPSTTTKTHPSFLWRYQLGVITFKMATAINKGEPRLPDLWFHISLKCTETFGVCLPQNERITGIHVGGSRARFYGAAQSKEMKCCPGR